MRRIASIAGFAVSLAIVCNAAGPTKGITPAAVLALRSWVQAVETHTPGRPDAAVVKVSALMFKEREDMNAGIGIFFTVLMQRPFNSEGNSAAEMVADIARSARGKPSPQSFLKRAAVLHSDAAAYADLHAIESTGVPSHAAPRPKELHVDPANGMPINQPREAAVPPLLTRDRIVLDKDGQLVGQITASWNWPFARSLVDLLFQSPGGKAAISSSEAEAVVAGLTTGAGLVGRFPSVWYHATTAYMFASGLYDDARRHLQRAGEVLPDDAQVLLDRASYAEILGLPMHQLLLSEKLPRGSSARLNIPSAEKTNAEAERLFRRALDVDPSLVEARVRLARLLEIRKRYQQAATELTTALAAKPPGVVAFYAHLFAGRAAQALARNDDAAMHYREAVALFPDAQSALLASSQLSLVEANVEATLAPIGHLGPRSAAFTADPWWQYHLGAGRDADALLREMWASVPHEP